MPHDNFRGSTSDEMRKCFDSYAHALTVISEPHRLIHDGMMFDASDKVNVLAGANFDVLIQFPVGLVGHLTVVEYQLQNAPVDLIFYENPTFSAAGTVLTPVNHNRLASGTTDTVMTKDPTITDVGDLLHTRYVPDAGGPGGQSAGQMIGGEDAEWVLGNGNDYLWRLVNNSGGAIDVGFHFNGYHLEYRT